MNLISIRRGLAACLFFASIAAHAEGSPLRAEAVAGEPFGVCRVTLDTKGERSGEAATSPKAPGAKRGNLALLEQVRRASVQEANGRDLYPASWDARLGGEPFPEPELEEVVEVEASGSDAAPAASPSPSPSAGPSVRPSAVLWFLFHGESDLDLKLANLGAACVGGALRVPVTQDPARLDALKREWRLAFLGQIEAVRRMDAYDLSLDLYLSDMLARRMGLTKSGREKNAWGRRDKAEDVVGLLTGAESIRLAMQSGVMLDDASKLEPLDQPLPQAAAPPELPVPPFNDGRVQVEPLAMRVPKECFYLRCAKFDDFLWLGRCLDQWGGELRGVVSGRGADKGFKPKLERQLALRETEASRRFGWTVVKDVALIGTDTFFQEGSAVGLLFQARNNGLLRGHLDAQRQAVQSANPAVASSTMHIGDREVALIESPDHAVRSFYVQDGDFHLVTNSLWIVQSFLATRKAEHGQSMSIGGLKEFRYARSRVAASDDGAFLYLSDPFFRNLVGPAYRVEMTRRARSAAELQVLLFARAAARAEGQPLEEVEALKQAGFLPAGFGQRSDGSAPRLVSGLAVDSVRGGRGSFLPVPDVELKGVTASEAKAYGAFAKSYQRVWQNMDPVFGSIRHQDAAKGADRIAMELHISPYAKSRYGFFLGLTGEALKDRVAAVKGDILAIEVAPKLEAILGRRSKMMGEGGAPSLVRPRMFAGLRDIAVPWRMADGEIAWGGGLADKVLMDNLRGYLGEHAGAGQGFLQQTGLMEDEDVKPDAKGFMRLNERFFHHDWVGKESEIWSRKFKSSFLVVGTGRKMLETVTNQIKLEPAPSPAQLRLRVGNLEESRLADRLRAELYARDRRVSAGGSLLLQDFQRQLHVTDAVGSVQSLMDAKLACPLGGAYAVDGEASERWTSSAWKEPWLQGVNRVPEGYRHPLLDTVLGLRLDLAIDPQALQTRMELDTRRK